MIAIQHIHPILVHFPIVLIYTLVVLDLVALASSNAVTRRSGVGTISTFVALAAGVFATGTWFYGGLALDHAEAAGFSSAIAETHESPGGITAFALLTWGVVRFALWVRNRELGSLAIAVPVIEVAGAALVTVTAYYGGLLVYDLGVNVARAATGG
ncbi:hypothetical protein EN858_01415 [Mesorhizobium sp. M4B.F.Ca.ET.215.01.1.1]|uniref:DUF2231 domain-containing protein n=1 Tax=unclassified Mesorhizobium TaxID=325217 RepID=UPI000FCA1FA8|nr:MULTISPECIES: DUF2231 domain-containing protein [unclassified Mesorhizobium]RUW27765.1 hypothetical protein EOA34_03480 [Mesorhizobium sp. M4B.F.Ca.ET.013.02.1.1]RVD46676.1 hypothetical protein EN741_00290 [Mesorhizobium sp. M4B.F.Ca.ET.019.03.1.1]RWF67775.1 MAG: hypothetical protein EOS47_00595 [Mesorhizobium sp.]TGQ18468.1 hypothetical protein EN858_01415 [Mesorhizobium sp. M4B.F.Ca.ET.215.01.1.1]TGQ37050.1 hypothetical protein EN857_15860 [Mesorhizobium sp. M4B.F.Ca.ET.214.01.1.1]